MTLQEAMAKLEPLRNEMTWKVNAKQGADDNQFGAKMGDIRNVAKEIKTDQELAKQLWETGNWDARLLATLIVKPKLLTLDELEAMVRSVPYNDTAFFSQLLDWLVSYVIKQHPQKEEVRQKWMDDPHPMVARVGWSLTAERVAKDPTGIDLSAMLDRIEKEMGSAHPMTQWTMNFSLAEAGVNFPEHRDRAIAIGEKLGLYRDYPVSKGCTSPFAPIWITEIAGRKG